MCGKSTLYFFSQVAKNIVECSKTLPAVSWRAEEQLGYSKNLASMSKMSLLSLENLVSCKEESRRFIKQYDCVKSNRCIYLAN